MPRYDIRCANGHEAEIQKPITAPLPPCPVCGTTDVTQQPPTAMLFTLKGSGWTPKGTR